MFPEDVFLLGLERHDQLIADGNRPNLIVVILLPEADSEDYRVSVLDLRQNDSHAEDTYVP